MIILLLIGFVIMFCLMSVCWLIQRKSKNAGVVDIAWGFGFPILSVFYAVMSNGYLPRRIIITTMAVFAGVRLGLYLYRRNWNAEEDSRYKKIREEWGILADQKLFGFFQLQAILATALSIIFLVPDSNTKESISAPEIVGVILWVIAFTGETIADRQLELFKEDPDNKGKICQRGLWFYSRHPNYFFQWLLWVSYFTFALGSPNGIFTVLCPMLMLYFLVKVTGIAATEEHMLQSKGKAFLDYQKSTSAFIIWPKKF